MSENKTFYSKIMLFGEYLLMCGSKALSIPYSKYSGRFVFSPSKIPNNKNFDPKIHLRNFLQHLQSSDRKTKALLGLDLTRFEQDIKEGLTVDSNIPTGYGLGSSGALVAAVYDKYSFDKIVPDNHLTKRELKLLRTIFSVMESSFHGKSSGFDPLTCYLNSPVLMSGTDAFSQPKLPIVTQGKGVLFLLDTQKRGETRPLVAHFLQQCEQVDFVRKIKNELIPRNNRCIDLFLAGETESLLVEVQKLSAMTYASFQLMIPNAIQTLWQTGLQTDTYSLKLCGSGGGGMMLGFTADFEKTCSMLSGFEVQKVMEF